MKKIFSIMIQGYMLKKYHEMFESLIQQNNITQIEIDVLAFLANNPEYKHAQDIVKVRGISKAHVSIAIEKLSSKGLLVRKEDPINRRCNILVIQDKALPLVTQIQMLQKEYKEIVYKGFSNEEKELYDQFLYRIYKNLGGNYE